jgi:hypothetical protein
MYSCVHNRGTLVKEPSLSEEWALPSRLCARIYVAFGKANTRTARIDEDYPQSGWTPHLSHFVILTRAQSDTSSCTEPWPFGLRVQNKASRTPTAISGLRVLPRAFYQAISPSGPSHGTLNKLLREEVGSNEDQLFQIHHVGSRVRC